MKRNIASTTLFLMLSLSLAAAALARDSRTCTVAGVAGDWGYTKTGTLTLPTGAAPFAAVGTFTLSADGNLSGTQNNSVGGQVGAAQLYGTFEVNSDCSGTLTVGAYDQSGTLLRTIFMALVFDDTQTELRGIVTSLQLPNGMSLPAVITGDARKVFPKTEQ